MGARWQCPSSPDPGVSPERSCEHDPVCGMKAAVPRPRVTQRLQTGVGSLRPTRAHAPSEPGSGTRSSCVPRPWHVS